MIPGTFEIDVCYAFDSYCKRTLKNEAINAHKAMNRRKKRILNFSDLALDEEYLFINPDPMDVLSEYRINGLWITNELLKAVIQNLPEPLKQIINLYYFDGLNDRKISEITQIPRSTIQNWRTSALEKIKHDLEENIDDWSGF
jgi:RNA polymerase sigma factor (sigma-70 family)